MKRIEHLINDVLFETNEQSSRFSTIRFNKIFNDAQQEIQRIIHTSNTDSKFFSTYFFQDLSSQQKVYAMPTNIYTDNAINAVFLDVNGSERYSKLRYNQDYIVANKKIELLFEPRTETKMKVDYTYKLNELSTRMGKVSAKTATTITLTGFDAEEDITDYDDYFTIVDRDGVIIDQEMIIESYVKATGVITTSSTITAPVNSYVVLGGIASTNSELPDACEKYMTLYVNRMVHYINSSRADMEASMIFSSEEKNDIQLLFAKNESDVKYPEIVDYDYLDYNERYY